VITAMTVRMHVMNMTMGLVIGARMSMPMGKGVTAPQLTMLTMLNLRVGLPSRLAVWSRVVSLVMVMMSLVMRVVSLKMRMMTVMMGTAVASWVVGGSEGVQRSYLMSVTY